MIHIGILIKEKMKEKRLSVVEFATLIGTDRNNVYHIFKRQSIDTKLLFNISTTLGHDFFRYYQPLGNQHLPTEKPKEVTIDWLQSQFKEILESIEALQRKQ